MNFLIARVVNLFAGQVDLSSFIARGQTLLVRRTYLPILLK